MIECNWSYAKIVQRHSFSYRTCFQFPRFEKDYKINGKYSSRRSSRSMRSMRIGTQLWALEGHGCMKGSVAINASMSSGKFHFRRIPSGHITACASKCSPSVAWLPFSNVCFRYPGLLLLLFIVALNCHHLRIKSHLKKVRRMKIC